MTLPTVSGMSMNTRVFNGNYILSLVDILNIEADNSNAISASTNIFAWLTGSQAQRRPLA